MGPPDTLTPGANTTPQSVAINMPFTDLSVTVRDVANNPVADGTSVAFQLNAATNGAGATFPDGTSATTTNGVASIRATANSIVGGPYTVTATTSNGKSATFQLQNLPGPANTVTPDPNTPQSAAINTTFPILKVTVTDAGGNSVADGTTVSFTVAAAGNGASVAFANSGNATTTSGVATMTATANGIAGGPYTVTAATSNSKSATFTLTNLPGEAAHITPSAGTPQHTPVGTPFTTALAALVKDAAGNPLAAGVRVTFTVVPQGGAGASFAGNVSSATAVTNSSGIATALTLTANGTAGSYTVTANLTVGALETPATFTLVNDPGAAVHLTVTGYPSPVVSGTSHPFTVTMQDVAGNTATGYTGTVHVTSTDSHATLPADYTFVASDGGTHTFTATFGAAGTWALTATDTRTASLTGTQSGIVVTAAALVSITVTPANATLKVGQVQQFVATGTYADNSTADLTGTVTWTSDTASVASVDGSGKGTGDSRGTAHITARLGTISGQTSVTVETPSAIGITAPGGRTGSAAGEPNGAPGPTGTGRGGTAGGTVPAPAPTGR
jgi:hypothetical protein